MQRDEDEFDYHSEEYFPIWIKTKSLTTVNLHIYCCTCPTSCDNEKCKIEDVNAPEDEEETNPCIIEVPARELDITATKYWSDFPCIKHDEEHDICWMKEHAGELGAKDLITWFEPIGTDGVW